MGLGLALLEEWRSLRGELHIVSLIACGLDQVARRAPGGGSERQSPGAGVGPVAPQAPP
jgi:hypothetical protein